MSQEKNLTQPAATTTTSAAENTRNRPVVAPPVDIYENADEYLVLADMPGVTHEDVRIRFEEGELSIHAARHPAAEPGELLGAEFTPSDYLRRFSIPETVDAEKIDARLQNGVLHLTLPKASRARPRQISVRSA